MLKGVAAIVCPNKDYLLTYLLTYLYSVFSFRYRINPTIKHQQNKLSILFPIFVREVYLIAVASSFCVVRCGDPTQNSRNYHLRWWMHSDSDVTARCGNSRCIAIIQNHRGDPP
jgi:hypothetical protein